MIANDTKLHQRSNNIEAYDWPSLNNMHTPYRIVGILSVNMWYSLYDKQMP